MRTKIQHSMFPLAIFSALSVHAQTNFSDTNALPKLVPPYDEMPQSYWEQHPVPVAVAGLGIALLVAFVLWLVLRRRPPAIISPELQARRALEELRRQPEDGVVLSRISQIVRQYFMAVFPLAPGEMTTAEFNRELVRCRDIDPGMVIATVNFLRNCDAHKFSLTGGPEKMDAANRALNLVEQAEQRRAQLRQPAATQTPGQRA